jgi:hypothetical protein
MKDENIASLVDLHLLLAYGVSPALFTIPLIISGKQLLPGKLFQAIHHVDISIEFAGISLKIIGFCWNFPIVMVWVVRCFFLLHFRVLLKYCEWNTEESLFNINYLVVTDTRLMELLCNLLFAYYFGMKFTLKDLFNDIFSGIRLDEIE